MYLVEILPDLWIGDTNVSPKIIKEKDIKYIINCHEDLAFYGKSREYIDSIKSEMMRKEIGALYKYLIQMTQSIYTNLIKCETVLIVGLKKSHLLIIGYLIKFGHMSLDSALTAINTKIHNKIILTNTEKLGLQYFQQEIAVKTL
jgi:hypothetical protein